MFYVSQPINMLLIGHALEEEVDNNKIQMTLKNQAHRAFQVHSLHSTLELILMNPEVRAGIDIVLLSMKQEKWALDFTLSFVQQQLPHIPIMLLTSSYSPELNKKAQDYGVEEIVDVTKIEEVEFWKSAQMAVTGHHCLDHDPTHSVKDSLPYEREYAHLLEHFQHFVNDNLTEKEKIVVFALDASEFLMFIEQRFGKDYRRVISGKMIARVDHCLDLPHEVSLLPDGGIIGCIKSDYKKTELITLMQDMHSALTTPISTQFTEHHPQVHIGVAYYPERSASGENLIESAKLALAQAQKQAQHPIVFYSEMLQIQAEDHQFLTGEFKKALENDKITLNYQPQLDIGTQTVVGLDVSQTWHHKTKGLIHSDSLMKFAESSGFVIPLGNQLIAKTFEFTGALMEHQPADFMMSIHLSQQHLLHPNFFDVLHENSQKFNVKHEWFVFNISEGALSANLDEISEKLNQLSQMGFAVGFDHYGKGFSSLYYLKNLQVDVIQIDKEFVKKVANDSKSINLIKTIAMLTKTLGCRLIATEVKTGFQAETLEQLGCEVLQGDYFYQPIPGQDVIALLMNHQRGEEKNIS